MKLPIIILSLLFCVTQESFGMSFDMLQRISNAASAAKANKIKLGETLDVEWGIACQCSMFKDYASLMEEISPTEVVQIAPIRQASNYPGLLTKRILIPDDISLDTLNLLFKYIENSKDISGLTAAEVTNLFRLADRVGASEAILRKLGIRLPASPPCSSQAKKDNVLDTQQMVIPYTFQVTNNREFTFEAINKDAKNILTINEVLLLSPAELTETAIKRVYIHSLDVNWLTKENMAKLKERFPNLTELCLFKCTVSDLAPDFLSECNLFTLTSINSEYKQDQLQAFTTFEANRRIKPAWQSLISLFRKETPQDNILDFRTISYLA